MSTIGVGRAFRNQDRLARERRERQEQTVDGQRSRRGSSGGVAPVSAQAVVDEVATSFDNAVSASRRYSAFAVLVTVVPLCVVALAFAHPIGTPMGIKAMGGFVMIIVFGLLSALGAVLLAAQGLRELDGLARWTDQPLPAGSLLLARATMAVVALTGGVACLALVARLLIL